MKTYLKDLAPDEVIRKLKAGEVLTDEQNNGKIKYIDGVLCYFCANGVIEYNVKFYSQSDYYFETPDELKLEVGKCYKTRDGRKAFISSYNSSTKYFKGAVIDFLNLAVWTENALYLYASEESNLDLISEWSDDND